MHRAKLSGFAVLVLLSLLLAVGGAVSAGETFSKTKNLAYYALGDSIASGYGLAGDPGVDCRQAPGAYPLRVASVLSGIESRYAEVDFVQLACTGAASSDLAGQVDAVKSDLAERRKQNPTDALVSITAGANDFGLSDPLGLAFQLCSTPDQLRAFVEDKTATVAGNVTKEVQRLLQPGDVYVVLTDYYNPFNTESPILSLVKILPGCQQQQLTLESLYSRTEFAIHELAGSLGTVADSFAVDSVSLASIHRVFHGRESPQPDCGSAPPGLDTTWVQAFAEPFGMFDCFHPNDMGARIFAIVVQRSARQLLPITAPAGGTITPSSVD